MARDYYDESKPKKKKKETPKPQKVTKSPSVTKVNNRTSNSTFLGGGADVKKAEKRTSAPTKVTKPSSTPARSTTPQRATDTGTGSRSTRTSRLTAAQTQKTYGTTRPNLKTAEEMRKEREAQRKEREERRLAAQRQKSGLNDQPTAAQKAATDRALKNTLPIAKESAKGAAYGHLTTLNDIASIKSSGNGKSREEIYDPALAEKSRQQAEQRVKKYQAKTQETEDAIQKLTKNAKGLEKAYYGAVESGTGMLTDMALGMGTQGGSLAAMFSRTYGSTRGKAQQEGATEAEDRAYAAAQAAKEVGTELMFPGAGLARGYAGKQGLKLADTAANILTKNLRGKAADIGGAGVRLLGGVLEENAEEFAGWGLDPLIKEITYGKNARTRNAQQAMKERSNALRAEIQNEDDARAAAAYLSSDDFFEQTVNAYREAGLSKKDAEEVADRMRDYLTASLTGDTDSMEQIEDEVSKKVAGSKKLEWDFDELKDTIASTTLLTAATGLPGTGMTAVKGAALRDQLGDDGVRALASTAIDFEDSEMSLKAKAMKARLDSGNELTSTQVYDLQVGMQEQIRKDTQREESSRRMADKRIKSDNLLTPYRQNENGGIDLDEATEASYREHVSRANEIIDGLTSETKESLTANEKVDGSKAIAGFQTGVFTIEDANTLNYSNTTVRAAFEEATGVDLGQYIVKNKDGSVNIPATNTATKDALFAMAADNLVKSAQAETANWMDNAKGQVVTQVSARMGASGSAVLQQALDDVDERDRSKYMMTANATDMLYQAARNMGTEWESIAPEATRMFPGISEPKLKMMYEAGLADREMANDKARGRQVRMGQALTEMGEQETATGKVFIDTEVPVKGSVIRTFTEIAKNLGADIHFVDYIYDSENNPIEGANGSYDPNTNTFYLNVATGAETNIGYIFMHETTHYLKTYAPEQYQALENLVRERWFAFNPSQMQDAIARKIEAYKRATKGQQALTEEQALEEIIADASHDFINDPEFARQVAEEDMGLAKAVLDSIRNALRMLRRIFASGSIDDDTHMNSLFRELDIMAEAEKLWLDAYKVAVQNSAAAAVDNWQGKANQGSVAEPIEEKQSFSISEPVERVKDLIAVHNLNEEDLVGNLGLGGFPMPSIAITKDSMGHEKYGDISLLFHSDTIDPTVTNANQVFGGDAYTPTFPTVHYKANSKVSKKLVDMYYNNSNTLGYDAMRPMYEYAVTIDDTLDRVGGEAKLIEKAKKDTALMRLYLRMNDKDVETITTSTTTSLSDAEVERNDFWINELGKDAILEARPSDLKGREAMQHFANWRDERFDELKKAYEKLCREVYGFDDAEIKEVMADEKTVKKEISSNIVAASLYLKNGRDTTKTEIDYAATNKLVEETAKTNGYDAWVDDLFKGIEEKSGIRNDKDWYTPAGNRRSWESLHEPVTLDNVVRQMKKELDSGGGTFLGNNPVGAAQKKYKSLDEIRADEDRLQYLDDENYGKLREQATAKLSKVAHEIYENSPKRMNSYAMFGAIDVGSDVAEALNKTRNKDKLKKILERDYSYNVSEQNMDDLMDALHDLANLPTGYFEAKPKRAVRFDEVKAAIVPEGFADHLKAQLSTYGTSIYEYNPEIEGDRTEKVNQAASENNLRFSISETDSDGNILTDGQMEYFKNSQARNSEGKMQVVYHTTNMGGFTVFDPKYSDDKRSLFFASNFDVSQTYGTKKARKPIDLNPQLEREAVEYKDLTENDLMKMVNNHGDFRVWTQEEYDSYVPVGQESYHGYFYNPSIMEEFENEYPNGNFAGGYRFYAYLKELKEGKVKDDEYVLTYYDNPGHVYVKGKTMEELLKNLSQREYDKAVRAAEEEFRQRQIDARAGYYSCYLNLENPLVVDANGGYWHSIEYRRDEPTQDDIITIAENESVRKVSYLASEFGDYNDDGVAQKLTLVVRGSEKNEDGEWIPYEYNESWTVNLDDLDDPYDASSVLSENFYNYLWKDLQFPDFYIDDIINEADKQGDIEYVPTSVNPHGLEDFITETGGAIYNKWGWQDYMEDNGYDFVYAPTYSTRELASLAEDEGYDGVIIRNVYDIGGASKFRGGNAMSDIFIAFSSEQVKDMRNENPTEDPDIRYSITPEDDAMEWLASQYELDDVPLEDPKAEEGRVRMAKSKQDFIKSRNALWNERWLTEGKVLDAKSVRKNIKELVTGAMMNSDTSRKYKTELVDKTLTDAKSAFWLMKEGKHSEAADLLWDSAVKMIENVDFIEDENFKNYKDLRDYMRTTSFRLGEEYWSDVDFSAFRKRNFGKIKLVKGETNIDEIYQELQERWPEWFDEDEQMTAPDQLLHIEEVLDAIQPYKIAYSSEEAEQLAGDIASDLYDIVYEGEEYKSIADTYKERYDAKTKALKERHQEALRKVREEGDLKVRKEKAKFKEYKEQKKNAKEKAKHFGRIAANIDWLTDRLLNETKDKNISEGFRKSLAHMLMQFDMQTERSKALEKKYGVAKKTLQMRELQKRLEQIAKEDDTGEFRYDGYLFYLMDALAEKVDGKPIDSLDTEDLIVIDTMLRSIKHNFSNYNKVRLEEEKVAIANIGDSTIAAMEERIKKYGKRKNRTGTLGLFDKLVNEGEQTPIYLFERLDPTGQGIGAMYKELRRGEDQHIRNMNFLRNRFQSMFQEYFNKSKPGSELESWRDDSQAQTFNLENGAITLNPAQIMSLYCLSKRTQAMGHILGSGIVASPINVGQKLHDQFKGKDEQVNSVRITYSEIQDIITKLTPEQMKLADEMQSLLNNEMAAWGNETSLEMHGIKLFREKDYFPIKSSGESLAKTADSFDVQEKIKNFGFTKPLVRNANNAIMIDDIFSVVADHCNKMSLYNSMAIPISDFMRVYNYKQRREDGTVKTSVQAMIGDAFTRKVNDYIMKFIGDVNGNTKTRSDAVNDLMNKALANYKKASIGANFRVALQQPTAIFRSLMAIDAKYFVGIKPISPADIREMFTHCPIALWKSWGHYDMDMGRDIEDIMMNNDWSRWDTATMGAYGALDNWTWSLIWQAVKKEVKANNPNVKVGSDEFFRLCNERASEVFDKTQVVDSIFHRSDTMRSKNTLTKMATSFMAEPTLTFNVFRDSLIKANEMWKDGDKTGAAMMFTKMAFVLALNAAAVSASAAIWDAVRGKGGGDDDDDEGFAELWLANFKQNFLDNAPWAQWNNIYFVKDIISLKDGWGTSNMALEGFETIFKGMDQLKKKITEGSDKSWYDIFMNLFGGFGYVTGVPVKTIMRDVKAVFEKFGIDVFAADGSEEDESLMDTIANKMGYKPIQHKGDGEAKVKDSFFARLGIGKTEEEKEQEAFDKKAEEIAGKTAELTGEAKDKKVWSYVTTYMKSQNGDKPLADVIQEGDYKKVQEYRDMYVAAGGDTEYFDERIFATSKSAMKKTIVYDPTDAQIEAQENIKTYLLHHGMTDAELSEMAYKSYTAKDMKIAFIINDKDAMLETLEPLVRAGLSYEDLERIWENRNRIDVMKYKSSKGRYADRLKSTGKFIWPTNGSITSYFGYRNAPTRGASSNHPAIDIGAPMGAEVVASDGGVVISTGWNGGYGNSVGIKHDNGMVTYYNHLSAWNVKVGDTVAQGQPIANVGSTGVSTGPHLDFKVLDANGKPVDPLKYLASRS